MSKQKRQWTLAELYKRAEEAASYKEAKKVLKKFEKAKKEGRILDKATWESVTSPVYNWAFLVYGIPIEQNQPTSNKCL